MLRHEAFNSLSAQLSTGWKCTTSQIKAPTCTHCTTTHQFHLTTTTKAQHSGHRSLEWLKNTMRRRTSSSKSAPTLLEWPCHEQCGFGSTDSTPVSDIYHSYLYKWGMTPSSACECGTEEHTIDHVVLHCPIHRPP